MADLHIWLTVAVIALTTAGIRFLPFLVWSGERKPPKIMDKLVRTLPYATMGMLVVYCLRDISFTSAAGFLPTLIAGFTVGILYVWKRNTLLSIIVGTVCYMVLVQTVF